MSFLDLREVRKEIDSETRSHRVAKCDGINCSITKNDSFYSGSTIVSTYHNDNIEEIKMRKHFCSDMCLKSIYPEQCAFCFGSIGYTCHCTKEKIEESFKFWEQERIDLKNTFDSEIKDLDETIKKVKEMYEKRWK